MGLSGAYHCLETRISEVVRKRLAQEKSDPPNSEQKNVSDLTTPAELI